MSDKNLQQEAQNLTSRPVQVSEKQGLNYWKVFTVLLTIILFVGGFYGFVTIGQCGKGASTTQPTLVSPTSSNTNTSETLRCEFDSKWFGFYFKYSKDKLHAGDSCLTDDWELTDSTWPSGVFDLTFYPRNNLSGKEWWRKYVTDEAGYLTEDKYTFDFTETPSGVEKMTVAIDNNKVNQEVDRVGQGLFRGSYYYFGEEWVIRDKVYTTGGPCKECEEFENSIKLIPIQEN